MARINDTYYIDQLFLYYKLTPKFDPDACWIRVYNEHDTEATALCWELETFGDGNSVSIRLMCGIPLFAITFAVICKVAIWQNSNVIYKTINYTFDESFRTMLTHWMSSILETNHLRLSVDPAPKYSALKKKRSSRKTPIQQAQQFVVSSLFGGDYALFVMKATLLGTVVNVIQKYSPDGDRHMQKDLFTWISLVYIYATYDRKIHFKTVEYNINALLDAVFVYIRPVISLPPSIATLSNTAATLSNTVATNHLDVTSQLIDKIQSITAPQIIYTQPPVAPSPVAPPSVAPPLVAPPPAAPLLAQMNGIDSLLKALAKSSQESNSQIVTFFKEIMSKSDDEKQTIFANMEKLNKTTSETNMKLWAAIQEFTVNMIPPNTNASELLKKLVNQSNSIDEVTKGLTKTVSSLSQQGRQMTALVENIQITSQGQFEFIRVSTTTVNATNDRIEAMLSALRKIMGASSATDESHKAVSLLNEKLDVLTQTLTTLIKNSTTKTDSTVALDNHGTDATGAAAESAVKDAKVAAESAVKDAQVAAVSAVEVAKVAAESAVKAAQVAAESAVQAATNPNEAATANQVKTESADVSAAQSTAKSALDAVNGVKEEVNEMKTQLANLLSETTNSETNNKTLLVVLDVIQKFQNTMQERIEIAKHEQNALLARNNASIEERLNREILALQQLNSQQQTYLQSQLQELENRLNTQAKERPQNLVTQDDLNQLQEQINQLHTPTPVQDSTNAVEGLPTNAPAQTQTQFTNLIETFIEATNKLLHGITSQQEQLQTLTDTRAALQQLKAESQTRNTALEDLKANLNAQEDNLININNTLRNQTKQPQEDSSREKSLRDLQRQLTEMLQNQKETNQASLDATKLELQKQINGLKDAATATQDSPKESQPPVSTTNTFELTLGDSAIKEQHRQFFESLSNAANIVAQATQHLIKSLSETVKHTNGPSTSSNIGSEATSSATNTLVQEALSQQRTLIDNILTKITDVIQELFRKSNEASTSDDDSMGINIETEMKEQLEEIKQRLDTELQRLAQHTQQEIENISEKIRELNDFNVNIEDKFNELQKKLDELNKPKTYESEVKAKENELLQYLRTELFPANFFEQMLEYLKKISERPPATQLNIMDAPTCEQ